MRMNRLGDTTYNILTYIAYPIPIVDSHLTYISSHCSIGTRVLKIYIMDLVSITYIQYASIDC